MYHSTLGPRVIKKKKNSGRGGHCAPGQGVGGALTAGFCEGCFFKHGVRDLAVLRGMASGDKPHVGIAGVTLHKTRPIRIIEDTNGCSFSQTGVPSWGLSPDGAGAVLCSDAGHDPCRVPRARVARWGDLGVLRCGGGASNLPTSKFSSCNGSKPGRISTVQKFR